jgi:O-antigen ligase
MPAVDPPVALVTVAALAGLWIFWWIRLRDAPGPPLSPSARWVSWTFVVVYLSWKAFFYVPREDVLDLVNSGMSDSNRIEVALTAAAGLWAAWLVISRRVPFLRLLQGASFWITLLVLLYALTSLWSVWPELTLYKSVELGVYWIIAAHLFATGEWRDNLERLAFCTVVAAWLLHIAGDEGVDLSRGLVGAFYDNESALMAGCLFLVGLHRLLTRRDLTARAVTAFAVLSLLLFHSFTTYLAVALALPALLVLVLMPRATRMATVLLIAGIAAAGLSVAWLASNALPHLTLAIAEAVGKDTVQVGTMTGRLPLWEALWEVSRNHPFGTGFLAVERTISDIVGHDAVGWTAGHSHNGFLSAWLAGGYPGIALLTFLTVALCLQLVGLGARGRALAIPFILFLLINNTSYPAFGGRLNGAWLMIMGLSFATVARPVLATATPASWRGATPLPRRG